MKIWDLGASGKAIPSWDTTKCTDHLSGHYCVSRATRVYWFNHLEVNTKAKCHGDVGKLVFSIFEVFIINALFEIGKLT